MGFEGNRKPPQFVIHAAMKEDASVHKAISSAGGKKTAENRKARELAEQARLASERDVFDSEDARILLRDAKAHEKALGIPKED